MNVLFAFPSRQRPKKFRATLTKLVNSLVKPDSCSINVIVDENDPARSEYLSIVEEFSGRVQITTPLGNSENKIHAVNRAVEETEYPWDIVCVMSDDMHVTLNGFDERIRKDMAQYYPNCDGLLHYNDGAANQKLITLAVMGRNLLPLMPDGKVYNPAYKSLYCDDEQMHVADMLGRRVYIPIQVVEHKHPSHGARYRSEMDDRYRITESFNAADKKTFYERKAVNFTMPYLTISIPTVSGRESKFGKLMAEAERQKSQLESPNWVEIIYEKDNKEISIGAKRDMLLRRSRGLFTQMIDDDDMPSKDALFTFTWIIRNKPNITHIGFIEDCTFNGKDQTPVDRSAKYDKWGDNVNGFKHVRTPDNKNPIRTTLCIAAGGYADMRYGEDEEFSKRILKYLTNEAYVNRAMYHYRYENEEHNAKYGIQA